MSLKYFTTSEQLGYTLCEHGVAVVPNVLDSTECEKMIDGWWEYIEHITSDFDTPICRSDESTLKKFYELYPKHNMLIQQWEIGHAQFVWDVRQNPKIIDIFKNFWQEDDLIVSFDGASFLYPPEKTGRGWQRQNSSWLHCDQSFLRNDFECAQSWVTAYDVKEGDATLLVLEGSHKYHEEFRKHKNNHVPKEDWYVLDETDLDFYTSRGCDKVRIECPAGSLVVWDSRTIHSGANPIKTRQTPSTRLVSYVCYTPRSKATSAILKKRTQAFVDHRTTCHWPHKPKLFPKIPRTYGAKLQNFVSVPDPILTTVGKSLI